MILVSVVSSWLMIHREELVLNIFIQPQYLVLTDTYKKDSQIRYKKISKRIYKKFRRVKIWYRQTKKYSEY